MFRKVALLCALIISAVCMTSFANNQPANDWLCIPGSRVGPITSSCSERQLGAIFGKDNVQTERIMVDEGESWENATFVFRDTKNEIQVSWQDEQSLRGPRKVGIYRAGTNWRTPEGITIGTTLSDLNRINGKALSITGFGWEYGGLVSFNKGKLAKYKDGTLTIKVVAGAELPARFIGDEAYFSSTDEDLANVGVTVDLIVFGL